MRAAIIGIADESFDGDAFGEHLPHGDTPAWDAEAHTDLSGAATLATGTALLSVSATQTEAHVQDAIVTEQIDTQDRVVTGYIVDFDDDARWMGVDTGDAEKLFRLFGLKYDAGTCRRATVDVEGVRQTLDPSEVWHVGWSAPETDADTDLGYAGATAQYHDDADPHDKPVQADATMLGFETVWEGDLVRGVVAGSGYVALYEGATNPDRFAAFVRDVVVPHAEQSETEQQSLDEVGVPGSA